MSAYVLDASAGVEIVLRTQAGRRLASGIPVGAERWVPELFYAEVAATLRRMTLRGEITDDRAVRALGRAVSLRVRRARIAELVTDAWALCHNVTVADAIYVVLARSLPATLVTSDAWLSRAPGLGVAVLTPELG